MPPFLFLQINFVKEQFPDSDKDWMLLVSIGASSGIGRLVFGKVGDLIPGAKKIYLQVREVHQDVSPVGAGGVVLWRNPLMLTQDPVSNLGPHGGPKCGGTTVSPGMGHLPTFAYLALPLGPWL